MHSLFMIQNVHIGGCLADRDSTTSLVERNCWREYDSENVLNIPKHTFQIKNKADIVWLEPS